jgi:carbon starvation protein CstA
MIADLFKLEQKSLKARLMVSIPLFVLGFALSQLSFGTIWKFLGLFNQLLSMVMLWTAAMYLVEKKKNHFILSLPATFMTAICATFILVAPNKNGGLAMDTTIGYSIGIAIALMVFSWFLLTARRKAKRLGLQLEAVGR